MHWKSTSTFILILATLTQLSCSKIDEYGTPYMLEGFTGIANITPGIEGITARSYAPALFFFNSNKDGSEVIMYGPSTQNFSLYDILPESGESQEQFRKQMRKKGISELDKLDFSGFRARVDPSNAKKAIFYAFGDQSKGMEQFEWEVRGEGIIDGPDSHIVLTISTTVGVLQKMLPSLILRKLSAPDSDVSLAEFEDVDAPVYLAQIEILGEALTIGY